MNQKSDAYKALCTEFYELDRPAPSKDALECYLRYANEANGSILEPMCGTGRFLIPLLEHGYSVSGFDNSPHMLNICREKCIERKLTTLLLQASFETLQLNSNYNLIYIPGGSFCHLNHPHEVAQALCWIAERLNSGGKFVFEIETTNSVREPQMVWRARSVTKSDGSKIVQNVRTVYDPANKIETGYFRYELVKDNKISETEDEVFHVRHYDPTEIEKLLTQHGLNVIRKWKVNPYSGKEAHKTDAIILYECLKN